MDEKEKLAIADLYVELSSKIDDLQERRGRNSRRRLARLRKAKRGLEQGYPKQVSRRALRMKGAVRLDVEQANKDAPDESARIARAYAIDAEARLSARDRAYAIQAEARLSGRVRKPAVDPNSQDEMIRVAREATAYAIEAANEVRLSGGVRKAAGGDEGLVRDDWFTKWTKPAGKGL